MAFTDFYRGDRWRKLRAYLMQERSTADGLICAHCGKPILKDYDAILHHVIELSPLNVNDDSIAYNPDNLVFVHHKCHDIIHKRFGGQLKLWQRKVYYVWGAPCSGKSTFVRQHAVAGDIICDIDRIWQCVSGQPSYIKPSEIKDNVFQLRDALLDIIVTRAGKWGTAWVVEGGALQAARTRRIEALGAEEIYIDTSQDECLKRLANDEERKPVQEQWKQYIAKYFDDLQQ